MNKKTRTILIIIVLIIGVGASVFAYLSLQQRNNQPVETKLIVVPSRNISAYDTIGETDLKTVKIPLDMSTEGYLTDRLDLLGKVATNDLAVDTMIPDGNLIEKEEISPYEFVTIKSEYTRTGGAEAGDVVDIYKVTRPGKELPSQTILVAKNAIVVSVANSEGETLNKGSKGDENPMVSQRDSELMRIGSVKLALDSRKIDVAKVVEGSTGGNGSEFEFVLVVKNVDSGFLGGN